MMMYRLPEGLTSLERRVLIDYLECEQEADLREGIAAQLALAEACDIEYTGVGFFRGFTLPLDASVARSLPNGMTDISYAEHPELVGGAMFMLFIKEGVVSYLEGVTCSGDWPQDEDAFSFPQ